MGISRSTSNAERLRALGAEPIVLDLLDPSAVREVIAAAKPEAIIHEATALAGLTGFKHFDQASPRPTGSASRAPTRYSPPLETPTSAASSPRASQPPVRARTGRSRPRTIRSTRPRYRPCARPTPRCATSNRRSPTRAGSRCATATSTAQATRPCSMLFVSAASRSSATAAVSGLASTSTTPPPRPVLALEHGAPGVYNIVEDDPAPAREWLPALAKAGGPRRPVTSPAGSPGSSPARSQS